MPTTQNVVPQHILQYEFFTVNSFMRYIEMLFLSLVLSPAVAENYLKYFSKL